MNAMQIVLVTLVAAIAGMGSVLDERQTHRPLIACTLIGLVLGDLKTGGEEAVHSIQNSFDFTQKIQNPTTGKYIETQLSESL